MIRQKPLEQVIGVVLVGLTLVGCSASPVTPTPAFRTGTAVASGHWEITVLDSYKKESLSGILGDARPKDEDSTFLVVETQVHDLDKSGKIRLSRTDAVIFDENGEAIDSFCMGSSVSSANGVGTTESFFPPPFDGDLTVEESEVTVLYVFIVERDDIGQTFNFQFRDMPLIAFSVYYE